MRQLPPSFWSKSDFHSIVLFLKAITASKFSSAIALLFSHTIALILRQTWHLSFSYLFSLGLFFVASCFYTWQRSIAFYKKKCCCLLLLFQYQYLVYNCREISASACVFCYVCIVRVCFILLRYLSPDICFIATQALFLLQEIYAAPFLHQLPLRA